MSSHRDLQDCLQHGPFKLLGVTLDKVLNFPEQVSFISKKKRSKVIGVLMRLRKLVPTTAKLRIYRAAIMTYFRHFCKGSD